MRHWEKKGKELRNMMLQNFQKPLQLINNKARSKGREGGKEYCEATLQWTAAW